MKTVQIEDGREIMKFETLFEIQEVFSESKVVEVFNTFYKKEIESRCRLLRDHKKEK